MENNERRVLLYLTPAQANTVLVALEEWSDGVEGGWTELEVRHPFLAIGKEKELNNCEAITAEINRQLQAGAEKNG